MEMKWSVVYTYPHAEKRIAEKLNEKNIPTCLPMQTETRQWSDRRKKIQCPIFPNYVFVQAHRMDHYKILSVPGVTRFILIDGKPVTISETEMKSIRLLAESSTRVVREDYYHVGDKVRVISGPFTGLQGMLIEKNGNKRFFVRFDSIEQAVSVIIDVRFLEGIV
jgi:transcription antitermination factor NusG